MNDKPGRDGHCLVVVTLLRTRANQNSDQTRCEMLGLSWPQRHWPFLESSGLGCATLESRGP